MDELGVAQAEAHAPAGHGVALGHGVEFHAHVLGALGLQEAGGLVAVEDQVGIGQVMDDPDVVLLGEFHDLFKEGQVGHFRGGVVGIAQEKQLGTGPGLLGGGGQVLEKVTAGPDGHAAHVGTGDDGRILVDGIGGVGSQHYVAGREHGQRKMGETFLGAHGHDGFGVGIEVHIIEALVAFAHGVAQMGDAAGERIAMIHRLLCGFHQLVHDVRRGGNVGISHAEVNDIDILATQLHFKVAYHRENVGGQALDARELFHGDASPAEVQKLQPD